MNFLRSKVHQLLEQFSVEVELLSDEEVATVHTVLQRLYYDLYILKAVQEAQRNLNPGDTLTREEAIQFLLHFV